jgi:hypothetical protein
VINDLVSSGKNACLRAEFLDGTRLTLGENAEVKVDKYVYDPAKTRRQRLIARITGAFLFISRRKSSGEVVISTEYAVVGVRGTVFWGGFIDDAYAIFVVSGEVEVSTNGGSVILKPGHGTSITDSLTAPSQPVLWTQDKRNRALATAACP